MSKFFTKKLFLTIIGMVILNWIQFGNAQMLDKKLGSYPPAPNVNGTLLYTCKYTGAYYKKSRIRDDLIGYRERFEIEKDKDFDNARKVYLNITDSLDIQRTIREHVWLGSYVDNKYSATQNTIPGELCELNTTNTEDGLEFCVRRWISMQRRACWAYDPIPCDRRMVRYYRWGNFNPPVFSAALPCDFI